MFTFGFCIWRSNRFPYFEVALYDGGGSFRNVLWSKRVFYSHNEGELTTKGWTAGSKRSDAAHGEQPKEKT